MSNERKFTLGTYKKLNEKDIFDESSKSVMTRGKPEIVQILREEERLGKLEGQLLEGFGQLQMQPEQVLETTEETQTFLADAEKERDDELGKIDEHYRTIFHNYAVAITLVDANENIISWNKYAEELLNMSEKDLFRKPVKSLYPAEEWKKIRAENVRRKGIKYRMETKMIRKNKEPFDVELSLCVLRGAQGKTVGSIGIIKDISKLKEAERALKESEHRYRTVFENSAVAIMLTDEKERIISWNSFAEEILGMTKDDLYLKPVKSLYPEKEWKKIRSQNVRQKGMQHHLETKMFRKDKTTLDVDLSLSVLKDHNGKIIGSIGVVKDITEQKQIEIALEESEHKFKQLYEKAPVPYHTLSSKGIVTNVSEKWCELLGYSRKEVIGKSIFDFIRPNERKKAQKSFEEKIRSKRPYTGGHERTYLTKSGEERIFVIHDFFSLYKGDNVVSVQTTMEDITERKHTEERIQESEEKYRAMFELSPQAIVIIDENGTIIDANQKLHDWLGYKPREIIGLTFQELPFIPKENKEIVKKNFLMRMQDKNVPPYKLEFITKHGEAKIGLVHGNVLRDKNKNIIRDFVAVSDITQREHVWHEMVKSEEKYRVLAETSADGVFTTDVLGRLTYVNPSLEKILGKRKSHILATLFRNCLSDNSVYLFQQTFTDVRKYNKKIKNVELEVVHSDGYVIPIEVNFAPLKKDDRFAGLECTVRDITERKRIERELKKSEQLKTEFMNIAAHELKSPVTPIKGYLELIISDKDTSDKVKGWAQISLRNSERLLNLVNDILDVSRLDTDTMRFTMEKIDPVELLNDAAEDMRLGAEKNNLKFITEIPQDIPKILGDKYRLAQVLKNLLTNAIKFTDHGSITLRAKKEDRYLVISVEDTGIGISKDELKKIFTKFYQAYTGDDRTKEGAGLGLFICKEIIKKHNGEIWVNSEVGKGCTFSFKLPI